MRNSILTAVLLATLAVLSPSHATGQTAVHVHADADDAVGARLAFALKERIRRSAGMALVDRASDAGLIVRFVTIETSSGAGTSYSIVWTVPVPDALEVYRGHMVGYCGSDRVPSCSDRLTAETDRKAEELRVMIRDAADRSRRR